MSEQTKTTQAENALEALQHAVDQAESHPSENKIEEADNALRHTAAAVRQAADSEGGAEGLAQKLQEEKSALEDSTKQ